MSRAFLAALFALLALTGCGYSIVHKGAGPFPGRSLHVGMFANRTYQPEVEGKLRLALLNELAAASSPRVEDEPSADLLLGGEVESLVIETVAFTRLDTAAIYRVMLTVQATVSDRKSGKIVWKGMETVREEYPASTVVALQRNARDAAVAAACREMARHLVNRMTREF